MTPHAIQEARLSVTALLADFPELAEDEQLRADTIEGETSFNEVVRRLLVEAQTARSFEVAMRQTERSIQTRRSRLSSRYDRLRAAIHSLMNCAALTTLRLPEATVSISQRGPQPVITNNMDELPPEFVTTKVERRPNKEAIAAAIKEGRTIPGVTMSNGVPTLAIRG